MKYGIRHKLSGEIWNKTSSKAQPWFERPAKYGGWIGCRHLREIDIVQGKEL